MSVAPSRPPSDGTSRRLIAGVAIIVVAGVLLVARSGALGGAGAPGATGPTDGSTGGSLAIGTGSVGASAGPSSPASTGAITSGIPGGSSAASGQASATATPARTPTPTKTTNPTPTKTTNPTPTPTTNPTPTQTARPTPTPVASSGGLPAFKHVYVVIMENEESTSIVGSSNAPYINSLIARYGLATNYTAVAHPSEPNYIALFSGSTHGVTDDGRHDLSGKNLADQIEAHGRDWRVYEQNLPATPCFTGSSSSGGADGSGTYARKHNPAISFTDISGDPARCSKIQDFSHHDPAAADYELIVPNLCNDMHDCSVKTGDTFLKGFLPKILDSPAMAGSALFLTWDEGSSSAGGGGVVATVVIGPGVPAGFRSGTRYTHYSLVRTIEDAWGLGCLASSCSANDLRAFWP
jgi:hypothetical protein